MAITVATLPGPFANERSTSPLLTSLVLGQPTRPGAADIFFPRVPVPSPVFEFRQYDNAEIVPVETSRAFSAPYKTKTAGGRLLTAALQRHSFAGMADIDQFKISKSFGGDPLFQARQAAIGKRIVDLTREIKASEVLTNTATYPAGHTLALASGSEWNAAGGDSQGDITTAADAILSKTAAGREELMVGLSSSALNAALADPVFKASRVYTNSAFPSVRDLAAYWGVKEVRSFNPVAAASQEVGSVPAPIYGDVAIVFVPMFDPANYDLTTGTMVFGAGFTWNTGVANVPFYDDKTSSWYYPWTDWFDFEVISGGAGFLITNCAA